MSRGQDSNPRRRVQRGRVVVFSVATVALVAACQPVKNSQPPPLEAPEVYCAAAPPVDATEYQEAFDELRHANTGGWIANDGGLPFALPDGRVLWFFGDTLLGLSPEGPVSSLRGIANNGFVVQDGRCFRPITEPIPDPASGEWIWPSGAVVEGDVLRVFGLHMRRTDDAPPFDFELISVDVTTFSLESLAFQDSEDLPLPASPTYGASVLLDNGFVYAYGQLAEGPFERTHYVARVPLGQVLDAEAWEFWSDSGWVPDDPDADPVLFDDGSDGVAGADEGPLSAFPPVQNSGAAGGYLGSAFAADALGSTLTETWHGAAPEGPWALVGSPAVDITETHGTLGPEQLAYGGRVVLDLPVGPLALWSTHHLSFAKVLENPDLYKVWFATPDPASIP